MGTSRDKGGCKGRGLRLYQEVLKFVFKNRGQRLTLQLVRDSEEFGGQIYELSMSEIMESGDRVRFIR